MIFIDDQTQNSLGQRCRSMISQNGSDCDSAPPRIEGMIYSRASMSLFCAPYNKMSHLPKVLILEFAWRFGRLLHTVVHRKPVVNASEQIYFTFARVLAKTPSRF